MRVHPLANDNLGITVHPVQEQSKIGLLHRLHSRLRSGNSGYRCAYPVATRFRWPRHMQPFRPITAADSGLRNQCSGIVINAVNHTRRVLFVQA